MRLTPAAVVSAGLNLALVGLVAFLLLTGLAHAQTAIAAAPSIDIHPLLLWLLGLAAAAVSASVPFLVAALFQRLGLAQNQAAVALVTGAVQRGAGAAYTQLVAAADQVPNPAIKSAALSTGAQYVLASVPAAATRLGLTPATVTSMVDAELGRLLAVDPTVTAGPSALLATRTPLATTPTGSAW